MRRKDREVTETGQIRTILDRARVIRLGLIQEDVPYIVPLHYGYELKDGLPVFYMHCAGEGHKLDLIRINGRCSFELDCEESVLPAQQACAYGATFACVMGKGSVRILESCEEKKEALRILMKTQTGKDFVFTDEMVSSVEVLCLTCRELTAKRRSAPV